MSEESSIGLLFKEALQEFGAKHQSDENICGIKIDLRSQGIDLIVGLRFVEGESLLSFCSGNTNCEGIQDDSTFNLLSDTLRNIGVQSKSGASVMIKRNATIVSTDEGCKAIEATEAAPTEENPKKRSGIFGLFGKK